MSGGSKKVTVGYWYLMDVLVNLGHGPVDEVCEIQIGERTAWKGSATSNQSLFVSKLDLFGGESREGGVEGHVDIMLGGSDQSINLDIVNSMRASDILGPVPAYRGRFMAFFRGGSSGGPAFRWSAMNPYFKSPRFKVRRYPKGWQTGTARIGNGANPAHMIRECLTNTEWGMGYPSGIIREADWIAAASALHNEGFGLSMQWTQQSKIEDVIKEILTHINGVISEDRTTGELILKLLRADYDTETLPVFSTHNAELINIGRPGLGEAVNEVTVVYTDTNGKSDSVTVQDLAGIESQGQIINQTLQMRGITSAELAARVAQREIEVRATPLSRLELMANRDAWSVYVGDVIKLVWPPLGIQAGFYRIIDMDLGTLADGQIRITAVEDVFGLPATSYTASQPPGWVDTVQDPQPVITQAAYEASYWEMVQNAGQSAVDALDPASGYGVMMARKPQSDTYRYALANAALSNGTYSEIADGVYTPHGMTVGATAWDATAINVNTAQLTYINTPTLGYLGTEAVWIQSVSPGVVTVSRGVLDSIPRQWPDGTSLWAPGYSEGGGLAAYDETERTDGEATYYKPLTVTSIGRLSSSLAASTALTFDQRANRPYPPARVLINGEPAPDRIAGETRVTWSGRNRLMVVAPPAGWFTVGGSAEPGTTYTVRVYVGGTLVESTEVVAPEYSTQRGGEFEIEIAAVRDGIESRESWRRAITVVGYGYRWDEAWGGVTGGVILPPQAAQVDTTFVYVDSHFMWFDPAENRAVFARTTVGARLGWSGGGTIDYTTWWADLGTMAVTEYRDRAILEPRGALVHGGKAVMLPFRLTTGGPDLKWYNLADFYAGLPSTPGGPFNDIGSEGGPAFAWDFVYYPDGTSLQRYPVSKQKWDTTYRGSAPISNGTHLVQWLGGTVLRVSLADITAGTAVRTEPPIAIPAAARFPGDSGYPLIGMWAAASGLFVFAGDVYIDKSSGTPQWAGPHIVVTDLTTYTVLKSLPITPSSTIQQGAAQILPRDMALFGGSIYLTAIDKSRRGTDGAYYVGLYKSNDLGATWTEVACPAGSGLWPQSGRLAVTSGAIFVIGASARYSRTSYRSSDGGTWSSLADTATADLGTSSPTQRLGHCGPHQDIIGNAMDDGSYPSLGNARQWPVILPDGRIIAMTYSTTAFWRGGDAQRPVCRYWLSSDGGLSYTEINVSN